MDNEVKSEKPMNQATNDRVFGALSPEEQAQFCREAKNRGLYERMNQDGIWIVSRSDRFFAKSLTYRLIIKPDEFYAISISGKTVSIHKGKHLDGPIETLESCRPATPEEIESVKPKRWRAEKGEYYYFIDTHGGIERYKESNWLRDDSLHRIGNYFKTEEEAKASMIYAAFHYEFWSATNEDPFTTNELPKEIPEGCEHFSKGKWSEEKDDPSNWGWMIRRWPKVKEDNNG